MATTVAHAQGLPSARPQDIGLAPGTVYPLELDFQRLVYSAVVK
jgi:hypothetical protein